MFDCASQSSAHPQQPGTVKCFTRLLAMPFGLDLMPVDHDGRDYSLVDSGETVGRVTYDNGTSFTAPYWRWNITACVSSHPLAPASARSGREDSFDAAVTALVRAWSHLRDVIGDRGWIDLVTHNAEVSYRQFEWSSRRS